MKPELVIHVDYGSAGSAGSYIERLLAAASHQCQTIAYLHHEFPTSKTGISVRRLFGRFSSRISNKKLNSLYRLVDLYLCLIWIALDVRIRSRRSQVYVVVSLFQAFNAYELFFRLIQRHCFLSIIVHDAVELKHAYPGFIMSNRDRMLGLSHRLLAHNAYSADILRKLGKPIDVLPFPPMRPGNHEGVARKAARRRQFSFVGQIREEKGVGTLIGAWRALPEDIRDRGWLTIAGAAAGDESLDFSSLPNSSIRIGFIEEADFIRLIHESDYMVFPYKGGSNSGVYAISSSLGRPSITTRIPVFSQSEFYVDELSFESESDLCRLISILIQQDNRLPEHEDYVRRLVTEANGRFDGFFLRNPRFFNPVL